MSVAWLTQKEVVAAPGRSMAKPFPDWVKYRPNRFWLYDTPYCTRCARAVTVIEDLVSRAWMAVAPGVVGNESGRVIVGAVAARQPASSWLVFAPTSFR